MSCKHCWLGNFFLDIKNDQDVDRPRDLLISPFTNRSLYFSRTLTHVHENMLNDLVYPAEIVGKRIRVKLDGSKLIKVHLDKTQQTNVEHKVSDIVCFAATCPTFEQHRTYCFYLFFSLS
jgi:hypothetical protein